jgi:ribosomal protein S18 acetylase RimI-like enzyme
MGEADVPGVALLHEGAFRDHFMTTFGNGFLRAFYAQLIAHPEGYGCVVTEITAEPVGFCVGGTGSIQDIARTMLRRRPFAFALPAIANIARAPTRLLRILRLAFDYLRPASRTEADEGEAHLLQIAVAERWRGTGAAELLVRDFLAEMARRRATSVRLGVKPDNARAIAFYRRMGFHEVRTGIFERRLAVAQGATP